MQVRKGVVGGGVLSHPQDTERGVRFGLRRVAILKGAVGVGSVSSHPYGPKRELTLVFGRPARKGFRETRALLVRGITRRPWLRQRMAYCNGSYYIHKFRYTQIYI